MKTTECNKVHFEENEKKAIIGLCYEVILADGLVHPNEIKTLHNLNEKLAINGIIVKEAQKTTIQEAESTLRNMSTSKKNSLARTLHEIAIADFHVHKKEVRLIIQTFKNIGIGR
ncbi:putative tellurite resistance protein B-like protein [Flavobacteriaceae bacterium MAR_2009_75]|nr:putative tellurite resistance protein B-like protein [Flavobacteriaceae bacterium MAR_2009_75]